ncbi:MAG: 16S rRNA (adenine(1518)-N(6)/adenine(1519)-N(6))-dimethyltransferase RsmA [Thermoflexales bacterium]|nr:16S rRNA (adenine(1518)-N(6)/adenine(1519)-N(6))-dimethyltransferase RsmA [Thermoflexales bacterium]
MEAGTRSQLEALGIDPRKSLGQNFLVHSADAERIAAAVDATPDDAVIEIGPGIGALTRPLLQRAGAVIAIELDPRLVEVLRSTLGGTPSLTVVHADALTVDFAALLAQHAPTARQVRFAANLPYYITSAAIRKMLESGLPWRKLVVTVQLEVAQRMTAKPGEMSLMSVSAQFYGIPALITRLGAGAFHPPPGVDSAVIAVTPHPAPLYDDPAALFALARAGFGQKRKQLINTLSAGTGLSKIDTAELLLRAHIDPSRRPETLSIAEWIALAAAQKAYRPPE